MVYEFEGRTEKEAIDRAAEELGLRKDEFDVEIIETQRSGLFKKGFVRIQVHTTKLKRNAEAEDGYEENEPSPGEREPIVSRPIFDEPDPKNDFEKNMIGFVEGIIRRMGYRSTVKIMFRERRKLGLRIDSSDSSIIIGKKGRTLDAMQLLANIFAGRNGRDDLRVILDSENYRIRREETLVRLAYSVADRVREKRGSILLEPMNPFDRRLIHTTLGDIGDVETKSEGEGLYKQVRVYYRGMR